MAEPRRARVIRRLSILLGLVVATACGRDGRPEWVEADGHRWRALDPPGGAQEGFSVVDPARAGIVFVNRFSEESLLDNDILSNGSGVALGDFDGDGLPDLYLTGIEAPNALYRNRGRWRFEDVTAWAGVALAGSVSRGAAWADVDGDGDLDLLVTRHSEPNVLFRNDGPDGFVDVSTEWGFEAALASHSLALADTDGDGDLDLYVTNYKDRWARDTFAPADRAYDRVIGSDGGRFFIRPGFEDYFRVIETANGPQRWEFAQPDEYYVNEGDRFVRVRFTDGRFRGEDGEPLSVEPDEWGLAVRFADLDGDGDPDIYVCNDINSPDHIWINDGEGGFRLIDRLSVRKTSAASMAVDVADVDRDGRPDIFVAEMLSPVLRERMTQVPEVDPDPARPGEIDVRPQVKRNTLQMGSPDGSFSETAFQAGVAASGWTWGAMFVDVDLDGYEDLLLANGNILDWLDGDAQDRTRGLSGGAEWRRLRLQFPTLEQHNVAFRNRGDGTFEDASSEWGFGTEADIAQGMAAADLDGDGDLDVVVNRLDAAPRILRNDASAPRVAVRLRGSGANTRAIGARVRLRFDGLPDQEDDVVAGGLYLSASDGLMMFAAPASGAGVLEVQWPGGGCTTVEGIVGNREYEVVASITAGEGMACTAADRSTAADPADRSDAADPANRTALRFEDRSAELAHVHHEEIFVDEFTRQPLVSLRLAQLGPGVSWIDDDGDGHADLWVGSGKGGRVARFVNRGASLMASAVGPAAAGDISTILPAPGRGLALVGQMNYEAADATAGMSLPSVLALGDSGASTVVEGTASSTGAMALADVDGDGELDLFVGGRVIPSAYPVPASSRLFRGGDGRFRLDERNTETLRGIGLVSGATFADIDLDGDPDLLLAHEWGPVRVLRNDEGLLVDATADFGLAELTGRWNGIATGDLDGDGRPDVVVTGPGSNTEAALADAGMSALFGDFDRNGVLDVIELARDGSGQLRPALRLGQLAAGLPYLRRVTPDNHAFASADLETLLGPGFREATRVEAAELRHVVLLNRGGRFDIVPLPPVAQRAPAFGVVVADFDADGHEDVLLAQNHFATRLDIPRHDAGRGLLLLGDGTGALSPRPDLVFAYGDGRGLAVADYDADGRIDIAIGQNGGPTRLWHNETDRRGIRVRLKGPPANPVAIGASIRVEYQDSTLGPVREIQAGSGYWSSNGPTQVFGLASDPAAVRIRWPDGRETRVPVSSDPADGVREVVASVPAGKVGSTRAGSR
ncbi:MAG: CRTAC1 family protein [Gemmatimonadota bacterium]